TYRPVSNPQVPPDGEFVYTSRTAGSNRGQECGVFIKCEVGYSDKFPNLCYAAVYVDGTLVYDPAHMKSMPPDINSLVSVSNLSGVEFYPGAASTPAEFD